MVVKTASGAGAENCCRAGAGHEFFDELQIFINLMEDIGKLSVW